MDPEVTAKWEVIISSTQTLQSLDWVRRQLELKGLNEVFASQLAEQRTILQEAVKSEWSAAFPRSEYRPLEDPEEFDPESCD